VRDTVRSVARPDEEFGRVWTEGCEISGVEVVIKCISPEYISLLTENGMALYSRYCPLLKRIQLACTAWVRFTLEQAMKDQRGSIGIYLLFL
jgi:hypothetical protein